MEKKTTVLELINFLKKQNPQHTAHAYEGEKDGIRIDNEVGTQIDFIETPDGIDWSK